MMKMKPIALLALGLLLTGCDHQPPSGQVAATVDGVEITRNELSSEPAMSSAAPGAASDAILPKVLDSVIDRKVAIAQAKALKLDQTPEFIARQQRMSESLLGQALVGRWSQLAPQPSAEAISAFITANPQLFSGHKVFTLDRIVTDNAGISSEALKPLNSMADITAYFERIGHKFGRGQSQVDSGDLSAPLYNQLIRLTTGNPLAVKQGTDLEIVAVERVLDAPVASAEQSAVAESLLRRQFALQRLAGARKAAKIEYAKDFAPAH